MGFGLGKNPQELETETLSALRTAVATLKDKAPDDAEAYKQFVLEVAQSVAGAAKGTSAAESAEIEKIRGALAETRLRERRSEVQGRFDPHGPWSDQGELVRVASTTTSPVPSRGSPGGTTCAK
jgi:iron uptake system EfeUOB component EfeO/EfeM